MPKTTQGLLAHCRAQLGQLYWYGTFGQAPTLELLNQKRLQYPERITAARYDYAKKHHIGLPGARVFDCAGLIKSYWMMDSPAAKPKYNVNYDKSANGLKACCAKKGPIGTMPDQPGLLVFMDGHVGIFVGGGKVIEARGFDYGVVETSLKARPWLEWGALNWLENEKEDKCTCSCCNK